MRLVNTYDQLKAAVAENVLPEKQAVFISWDGQHTGRGATPGMQWVLASPFFPTYPEAPWYDHGRATFATFLETGDALRERKANALIKAFAWAKKKYGIKEWERNGSGDYVPKPVQTAVPLAKRPR